MADTAERKTTPQREDEIIQFWKDRNIFAKSVEQRPEADRYVFIDGPPFVSGSPHYAHLLVSIAKDLIPRYWTMKGKRVRRVFGWDCHGLPIEAKVNEQLGLRSRRQVEEYGVDRYVAACRQYVESQISDWRWYIDKIGRWVDLDRAYRTMDFSFGESVIWAFKQMYDKGLIYTGKRISLYSTETSTPVSEFEVAMDPDNYRDVEDLSVYVKFALEENPWAEATGGQPVMMAAWTTTPWTLPSNFALAVNPSFIYVLVQVNNEYLVVAEDRLSAVWPEAAPKVIKKLPGAELAGLSYRPLFDFFVGHRKEKDYKIYLSEGVTNTEGTGVLHVAPAFGEMDFELGKQQGLSDEADIDEEGRMTVGPWRGVYIRKASPLVAEALEQAGKLLKREKYVHRLPFYRGKQPLIYKAQDAYFIRLEEVNKNILELNASVRWVPEAFKEGRFRDVVSSAPDWGISRSRYWGTVMPIWKNKSGEEIVAGSVEELRQYTGQITERTDDGKKQYFVGDKKLTWHRDVLDQVVLKKDGQEYRRVPDILDVWLDSGSVPFAEYHYPFENRETFERGFPADFIIEYTGQIRAWFQVLFRVAAILFDKAPFRNVLVHGVLAGTDGRKMSKTFGNYPDPKLVLTTLGADALRLYFMSSPLMAGESANFNETELKNKARGVLSIFWNSAVYFMTYARSHDFVLQDATIEHALDKWIRTRLQETLQLFSASVEAYVIPPAVKAAEEFINDLSTWYIRRSRDRITRGDRAALATLHFVLLEAAKGLAPLIPFVTESIYQDLKALGKSDLKESVHLEDYPGPDAGIAEESPELMRQMALIRALASATHSVRKEMSLPLKQPLRVLYISSNAKLPPEMLEILRDEVNVKSVLERAKEEMEISGVVKKQINAGQEEYAIALETAVDEELKLEGAYRNLVRQLQALRQQAGLQTGDRVAVKIEDTEQNRRLLSLLGEELKEKVGAADIAFGEKTILAI